MKVFPFDTLEYSNLVVDAIYESSHDGKMAGEPIARLSTAPVFPWTPNWGQSPERCQ